MAGQSILGIDPPLVVSSESTVLSRNTTSQRDREYRVSLSLIQEYSRQGQVSKEAVEIERILALAEALSDNSRLAESHAWKSKHLTRLGNYQEARGEGEKALGFANVVEDQLKIAEARLAIG